MGKYLPGRVAKEKMTQAQADEARSRIRFTPSLEDAAKGADYVIEAAVEVLEIKRKLFADLDKIAPAHAILATNSSSLVSSLVADATQRPGKVINLHFFNPALVMKLVEVVQGPHVADDTVQVSLALCDRPGQGRRPREERGRELPAQPPVQGAQQGGQVDPGDGDRLFRRYRQGLCLRRPAIPWGRSSWKT